MKLCHFLRKNNFYIRTRLFLINHQTKNMKKILLAFFAALTVTSASAQMADGSICPDFTGTDLNGNTVNLYSLLDQGYAVVIDVSAAWCGPCWSYHNSGALEELYTLYGPEGTNEVRVLFIEGESSNSLAQLEGDSPDGTTYADYSTGDWITGTPYPIIDDASIADLLQISYFPTVYTVCPSRIITETGQASTEEHYDFISQNGCQSATLANDPSLVSMTAESTCETASVMVQLQNFGTQTLTAATITVTGGTAPVVYNWSGSLATYAIANVNIGTVNISGTSTLVATITSADGNTANNSVNAMAGAAESTTNIRVDILFDNWPEEVSWTIEDDNGNVVVSSPSYASVADQSTVVADYFVPSSGCYTFTFTDGYGDGLHGAQYTGSIDGHMYVYGLDANGNAMPMIYNYNGSYDLDSESRNANVTSAVSVDEASIVTGIKAYPNPSNGVLNINYALSNNTAVSVEVIDMVGNVVMFQNIGNQNAGTYTQALDLTSLASGMYMVNVKTNDVVNTLRVTLNK
jgi:Secretion system C-terminal sorting domain